MYLDIFCLFIWTTLQFISDFFNSIFGKFFVVSIVWSFSFQILSEIRHLFWDLGYGFDLKISNVTGLCVIFGSFISTVLIYFFGRGII